MGSRAGPATVLPQTDVGLSYKEIVEAVTSFLEVSIHTILYLRQIYPSTTFSKRRAHGVPVYQNRHPQVREYIAEIVNLLNKELLKGNLRRLTVVIKSVESGVALERFLIDIGYLSEVINPGPAMEQGIVGAPKADHLSMLFRAFLIRLTSLDTQLEENKGETTFAIVVETKDDLEPTSNAATDGLPVPWVPALTSDTLHPPSQEIDGENCVNKHEPLLHVRALETGVIDLRLMVQECIGKTGVDQLMPFGNEN